MKKVKAILAKMKAKTTILTYQRPLYVILLRLTLCNFAILLLAAYFALLIDGDHAHFNNFFEAFAFGSIKWMIAPNSILAYDMQSEIGLVLLAGIVIVIEMVLFSGVIIATITAAIKTDIDKKNFAQGKIPLKNHFVILNWNSKVPDIICNLALKPYDQSIIIFSDKNKDYIMSEINSLLKFKTGLKKTKVNLLVKQGNPLLRDELENINIKDAAHIIVMAKEMSRGDDTFISNADLFSLKVLLTLANFDITNNCNIVVEVEMNETRVKIENFASSMKSLRDNVIIPVSFNRKLGQIIGQTILNPHLADIYTDLLSFEGSEFYAYKDLSIEEYLVQHDNGIPIINVGNLFVLSKDKKALNHTRDLANDNVNELIFSNHVLNEKYTVFMIGENKKKKFIFENLKIYMSTKQEDFVIKQYDKDDIQGLISDIKATTGKKKVLVLSDDSVSTDSFDANVFVTLIALHTAFPNQDEIAYITELLDSRNLPCVKDFNVENAIVSNQIMSLLLTQLSLNENSKKFYDGLLTVDDAEGGTYFNIENRLASEMLTMSTEIVFPTKGEFVRSFYYSSNKKYMVLGIIRNELINYLDESLDEKNFSIYASDELIFIKY